MWYGGHKIRTSFVLSKHSANLTTPQPENLLSKYQLAL
ncbi:serine (or cysteine) peptidase inhibitor, clade I, member 1, isoform CRA_b, partial [Rattus norvegicus]